MTSQTATERKTPIEGGFKGITGSLNYEYDPLKPHQATKIGTAAYRRQSAEERCDNQYYYNYDANGNVVSESENPYIEEAAGTPTLYGEVRSSAPAWGVCAEQPQDEGYVRYFRWDEENRLKSVREGEDVTSFHYDADGIRTSKVEKFGESFYFSAWWSSHSEAAGGYRNSKHIFVGSERVVTSQSVDGSGYGWTFEDHNSYWYHPDHLGSTALVTDSGGNPYERMDYLAYGQSWIEKKYEKAPDGSSGNGKIYHRFTSKEWDEETGLYAFPKRYYEPRLSRWMSVDPAGFELANPMERGQNGELQPKSGYSVIEALNHYSYCSNNPVRYVDPTGAVNWDAVGDGLVMMGKGSIKAYGAALAFAACGGATVASGGTVAPAAVLGMIVSGGGVVDGAVEAIIGFAIVVQGLQSEQGDKYHKEVPTTLSEMFGIAGDAAIEAITGEKTDTLQTVGETVGDLPPGFTDLLFPEEPQKLDAPGLEVFESKYLITPTPPETEAE